MVENGGKIIEKKFGESTESKAYTAFRNNQKS